MAAGYLTGQSRWGLFLIALAQLAGSGEIAGMKVGFIGIGNMGGPMCRNIIRNTNHEVVVFDLSAAALKACTDLGASAASSIADLAGSCDVVITSLPLPRVVEDVALGSGGVAENARPGTVFIDLSTNSPATAKRVNDGMRAKGIPMLEAPVSGGKSRARMERSSSWSAVTPGVRTATAAVEILQRRSRACW